jgi:hypothetical protein
VTVSRERGGARKRERERESEKERDADFCPWRAD